jgi:hypothetical protein
LQSVALEAQAKTMGTTGAINLSQIPILEKRQPSNQVPVKEAVAP